MNIWEKERKKAGVTTIELANAMNISEEKVKEIEMNTRELPTSRVDEYLEHIRNLSRKDRDIKIAEARVWFSQIDLEEKIKEFGFKSQKEFAKKLGVVQSCISVWSRNKRSISTNNLLKLYLFFNNEFNKQIERPVVEVKKEQNNRYDWYVEFNLNKFMKENKLTNKIMADGTGLGMGTISRLRNKYPATMPTINTLYNYVTEISKDKEEIQEEIEELTFGEEEQLAEEEIIKNNSVEIETNFEDYFQGPVIGITNEEEIKNLREELSKAIKQIKRYETLLDMIIDKKEI